jgi:hypothetical protein
MRRPGLPGIFADPHRYRRLEDSRFIGKTQVSVERNGPCYPLRRSLRPVRPDELERRLQERLDALGPAPRAELLHVLMLPDFKRADRIGEFWGYPESRSFAELLIDCEEDRTLRPVLLGMLREADRSGPGRR